MDKNQRLQGIGGYIFVSHSHDDLEKVRVIRNYLESKGIEPILFYLHCMKDGNKEDMAHLWNLICREIDARDWFLYLDSDHARGSEWVQREMAYASKTKEGYIVSIDLDSDLDAVKKRIEKVSRAMRVFISHSHQDQNLYRMLKAEFCRQDFWVFDEQEDTRPNAAPFQVPFEQKFTDNIDMVCQEGCFVPLVTSGGLHSAWVLHELRLALRHEGAFVFPIITKEVYAEFRQALADSVEWKELATADWTVLEDTAQIPEIVRKIRLKLISRFSGQGPSGE